jgi:hypothetical protein
MRIPLLTAMTISAGAMAHAQAIRYAPGAYKYSIVTVIKRTDKMGDQQQLSTLTADQRMSLALVARGADSMHFKMTLDEYSLSSDLPIQLPNVERLKGTVVEGVMTPAGRMTHFTHTSMQTTGAEVVSIAQNMSRFLVALTPLGAPGKRWTDTTDSRQSNEGGELEEKSITTTTIDGDTVYNGAKAWRLRRQTTFTATGTTMQNQMKLEIASEGSGSGTYYVSERGVYLGARNTSLSNSTIKLPDGRVVALTQDATSTVSLTP